MNEVCSLSWGPRMGERDESTQNCERSITLVGLRKDKNRKKRKASSTFYSGEQNIKICIMHLEWSAVGRTIARCGFVC